jgi:hypothetical protein
MELVRWDRVSERSLSAIRPASRDVSVVVFLFNALPDLRSTASERQ